jgi:hypothetical protein
VVRDLGSRNGTFVNGKPIAGEVVLHPGDLLVIGPMGLRVPGQDADAAESKSAPRVKKSKSGKLSDDDIQAWLGLGSDDVRSDSDTAVIESPAPAAPVEAIPAPARRFRTVAEEAADIIRRHQELSRE